MAMSFDDALNAIDRRLSEKATYRNTDPKPSITPGGSELRSQTTGLSLRELITCNASRIQSLVYTLMMRLALEDTLTTLEAELNCPVYVASSYAPMTADGHISVVATGFCAFTAN